MSDYGLTKENLMTTLPLALRGDPAVTVLAETIAETLARRLEEADRVRIFANIDRLEEPLLDILARDLKVDWYDYDYPVAAKRAVIKSSVLVHKRLGTVYAVKAALGSVFPGSEVEEWFDYGGEPYRFQVTLNTAKSRAPAECFSIRRTVDYYKRFSAHMDGLVFQCGIGICIDTLGRGHRYCSPWTGRPHAGTVPRRNMKGGVEAVTLNAAVTAAGHTYGSPLVGTQPQRNTPGGVEHGELELAATAHGWPHSANPTGRTEAGTTPWRGTSGGAAHEEMEIKADAGGYPYVVPQAGTKPYRATLPGLNEDGIEVEARARGFPYVAISTGRTETGTVPQRSTRAGTDNRGLQIDEAAKGFLYRVPGSGKQETGTFPDRETGGAALAGSFFTKAEAEGFHYRVPMCGTSYCRS